MKQQRHSVHEARLVKPVLFWGSLIEPRETDHGWAHSCIIPIPWGRISPHLHHLLTWLQQCRSASQQPSWSTPTQLQRKQPIQLARAGAVRSETGERERERLWLLLHHWAVCSISSLLFRPENSLYSMQRILSSINHEGTFPSAFLFPKGKKNT